jgi:hypothetical protein
VEVLILLTSLYALESFHLGLQPHPPPARRHGRTHAFDTVLTAYSATSFWPLGTKTTTVLF